MTTAPIRSDWVGRVIDGKFPLQQWLGGSEGSGVFLTGLEGRASGKAVIRLIPADGADAQDRLASWTAAKGLSHSRLIRLFQTGQCEIDSVPLFYAVSEYAEENLAQVLPDRPLTAAETAEMLAPVLESLAHLHGRGFVHGSLKPSNILVVEERLKLSTDHLLFPASEGAPSGSDDIHDAPELATGLVSPAADIWSLGVLLVEALTQKPPVWDESGESDPVVPQSLPQPYLGIASACLRRDPKDRRTLNGVRALLDPSQAPPASARKQPEPAAKNETAQPSRRSGVALPIAAAIVLLAAISLFLIRSHRGETRSSTGQESAQSDSQASSGSQAANESGAPKGEVVSRVLPDLLPEAKESIRGEFGLTVRVKVDPSGNVVDASLDQPGPSRYFASQSIEAARLWKFKPPQAAGHPVPSVWTLEFRFTQDGTEIVPVEVSP